MLGNSARLSEIVLKSKCVFGIQPWLYLLLLIPKRWFFYRWQEISEYDWPAIIEFVLEKTNASKLTMITHGTAAIMGFSLFSSNQQMQYKVNVYVNEAQRLFPILKEWALLVISLLLGNLLLGKSCWWTFPLLFYICNQVLCCPFRPIWFITFYIVTQFDPTRFYKVVFLPNLKSSCKLANKQGWIFFADEHF